ncbi:hypothetical protein MPLDJ20_20143 [Mesorhizobium plurifarium]|uniref:Uncharacterized protein n=1 Tax=Mesorhizobium plurifarium TaxID=69974 RepID=A0A090F1J1_MESPL|nr:hypothetical protein MPLDJ20_20143 [Mesorhizobium plurifarium]
MTASQGLELISYLDAAFIESRDAIRRERSRDQSKDSDPRCGGNLSHCPQRSNGPDSPALQQIV